VTMASLFDIGKAVGKDGKEITPIVEYNEGFVRHVVSLFVVVCRGVVVDVSLVL
jgi:hypothetical protein